MSGWADGRWGRGLLSALRGGECRLGRGDVLGVGDVSGPALKVVGGGGMPGNRLEWITGFDSRRLEIFMGTRREECE